MIKPSVILMGSKPAAVVALAVLLERGGEVKNVVVARNVDLSWYGGQPRRSRFGARHSGVGQRDLPRDAKVDFVIRYQFRHLVKPDALALARRAALNFHAAPLPAFGGWAFYNLAILEDISLYGCTSRERRSSLATITAHLRLRAAAKAAAAATMTGESDAPLPLRPATR